MLHIISKKKKKWKYLFVPITSHRILTSHNLPYLSNGLCLLVFLLISRLWQLSSFQSLSSFKCLRRKKSSNSPTSFYIGSSFIYLFNILPHSKKGFEKNGDIGWHGSVREKLEMTFPNSTLFSETMSSPYKDGKITKSHTVKVEDSLLGNKCPRTTILPGHL